MNKNLIVIRTLLGEDILGMGVHDKEAGVYVMENVIRMIYIPEKNTMAFVPVGIFSNDRELKFNDKLILLSYEPKQDIANQYNIQFGSGLVLPEKQGIILP